MREIRLLYYSWTLDGLYEAKPREKILLGGNEFQE